MGLSCGSSLIKYLLFTFNFICAFLGLAFLSIGVYLLAKSSDIVGAPDQISYVHVVSYGVIILGVTVFLISFIGCCGAITKSSCMVTTYSLLLLLVLIIELVLIVTAVIYGLPTKKGIAKFMNEMWDKRGDEPAKSFWNTIQPAIPCCGLHSPADWLQLPPSCCEGFPNECTTGNSYQKSCMDAVEDLEDYSSVLLYLLLAVVAVEMLAIILACILASAIRKANLRFTSKVPTYITRNPPSLLNPEPTSPSYY